MASPVKSLVQPWPRGFYRRRYVWQWPVRLSHWINVISVMALFLTGEYIAHPQLAPSGEPFQHFVMGRVRQVHFALAFIFLISFLWRAAWWRDLFDQARNYLSLHRGHVHLGHNALAGLAYTIFVIGLGWGQIFTGMALYSESNPGGFWDHLVGWVIPFLGGSFRTHMWHHMFSWAFIVFAVVHLYVVLFDSHQYRNGLTSSMISGYKFYQEGDLDHDSWLS